MDIPAHRTWEREKKVSFKFEGQNDVAEMLELQTNTNTKKIHLAREACREVNELIQINKHNIDKYTVYRCQPLMPDTILDGVLW